MSNFCFYWNSISILWALRWVSSHRKVEKQKLSQNHHNTAGLASCGPKTKIIKIEKKKRNGARARRHKNDKNDAAARNPISHPRVTSVFNLRLSLYYQREREKEFQFWREIEIKKWIRQTGTILSITASMIKTHLLISLGPNKSTLFGYSFNLSLNFLCRWLNLISV